MAARPDQFYWDSCAWLGLINGDDDKKEPLEHLYGKARRGEIELWTSTIAIVEINRLGTEMQDPKPLDKAWLRIIDDVLLQRFVKLVPLDFDIATRARCIVRETPNLQKKWDAAHIASALRWNIATLHTYDKSDLLHLDGHFRCDDGQELRIVRPDGDAGLLFGKAAEE
ncbi:PIN domain-containing protein [Aurantimonas sp. 22II-16-19i]|uniref:type II toxin-antitoxin system VapC family toxin n=1 Tax=Aurantimonas sp. 22II-16-19i TaxID=1317114 RepID=UPI0009F7DE3D|nr:PIN domain-containing protein [Aurantimonas sp. 22II-16-19i]ORE97463.1 dipeptide/oligopeptide/nickel ABC transporter periplasmic protein [Aurantimonas sp. 22II-16-19i]